MSSKRRLTKSTDEPMVLEDDRSEGGTVESVKREARDSNDSNGYISDNSTAGGKDKEFNTLYIQPTSVSSSGDR